MNRYERFLGIIRRGMRYEFDGTELTVTDYWTGECITIDLGALTEEAFNEIDVYPEAE